MLVRPVTDEGVLSPAEEELLDARRPGPPDQGDRGGAAHDARRSVGSGRGAVPQPRQGREHRRRQGALKRLRILHQAIVDREEQGETLSRLLPGGIAEKLRNEGRRIGETEELDVTVLMSDIRGYSTIAEATDPSALARQLNTHRAEMNTAILGVGGTVMQFVGDAVMAVFGAPVPQPDHADRSVVAAHAMHDAQQVLNVQWAADGLPPFGLGIGLSTGRVAAALLGSDERLEYTLVGDTVNLSQRLQQWAEPGETVLSQATVDALSTPVAAQSLPPATVKGRQTPVHAAKIAARNP